MFVILTEIQNSVLLKIICRFDQRRQGRKMKELTHFQDKLTTVCSPSLQSFKFTVMHFKLGREFAVHLRDRNS